MKTVDFSEPIAASDLKAGRCRQLIEEKCKWLEKRQENEYYISSAV